MLKVKFKVTYKYVGWAVYEFTKHFSLNCAPTKEMRLYESNDEYDHAISLREYSNSSNSQSCDILLTPGDAVYDIVVELRINWKCKVTLDHLDHLLNEYNSLGWTSAKSANYDVVREKFMSDEQ